MASKQDEMRDMGVYEVVFVIQDLSDELRATGSEAPVIQHAETVIEKLVGSERESESRWSSRHIRVDRNACANLAESLSISYREAYEAFIDEPLKRAEKVAAWALDKADEKIAENGAIHGQRGPIVADIVQAWAEMNQCGIYRTMQPERQGEEPGDE